MKFESRSLINEDWQKEKKKLERRIGKRGEGGREGEGGGGRR